MVNVLFLQTVKKWDFIMQLKSSTILLLLHQNLPKEINIPEARAL